jgi:hypothetical protein
MAGLESRGGWEEKAGVKLFALTLLALAGCHQTVPNGSTGVTANDLDPGYAEGNDRAPIDMQEPANGMPPGAVPYNGSH